MKIIIENTNKIVELNGVPARIWEGLTDSGIKVHCFITRIAVDKNELRISEFEKELQETRNLSPELEKYYPSKLIL
ncbi:hypothetical protein OCV73_00070 [Barnesiella propionica]|uniref:hypothetical protein n=1 Tax=Barnesiella propionica TaxID=2981781 RepID=UPI0021D238BC|nr:hypothetical protein [Barnesiella propionica]MCU6767357.1 hypothetical protein [Barnesiella propionica]